MLYLSDFHQYIIFLLLYSLNASNYLIFILVYNKILSTNATFRVNAYFEPQFSEYLILGIFEIVKYFDLVKLTLLTKNFTKSRFDCMNWSIWIQTWAAQLGILTIFILLCVSYFPATLILCEINFGRFQKVKKWHFNYFVGFEFWFHVKSKSGRKIKFPELQNSMRNILWNQYITWFHIIFV